MKIGYARVSTEEQNLEMQRDALLQDGCGQIFEEKVSGAKKDRPELDRLLSFVREGDVIVVWKLDRLGRSLKHLVELVDLLLKKNVGLKSLNDPIDTSTSQGRFVFNIFAALSEFERDIIRERTKAGLAAARARGRVGGRKKGLTPEAEDKAMLAESLYKERKLSTRAIAKRLGISVYTLYAYLRHRNVEVGKYERKS
jgi:DNA invertase Pin-like site-specific DNA recombinase